MYHFTFKGTAVSFSLADGCSGGGTIVEEDELSPLFSLEVALPIC